MKVLFVFAEESYMMPVKTKIPKRWAYFLETASFIKKCGHDVKIMDCLDPKISHGEILNEYASNEYDVTVMICRIETLRSNIKLVPLLKKIRPETRIIMYGDIVNYYSQFIKYNIPDCDAVIESGDYEKVISEYIESIRQGNHGEGIKGLSYKISKDNWSKGIRICSKGTDWQLPLLDEENFINKDLYLGITDGELTITVSRGCQFACGFCPAVTTYGKNDRRKDVKEVINYIKNNSKGIKSFKLFSPTLTADKEWVKEFCRELISNNMNIKWTGTTRPDCLDDEEMIELMGKSGCYKIAMGIETLDDDSVKELGKFKNYNYKEVLKKGIELLIKNKIDVKPLMMLGIPGQTKQNLLSSVKFLNEMGVEYIRFASYSPRQNIHTKDFKDIRILDYIESLDKMTYKDTNIKGLSDQDWLRLVYSGVVG